MTASAEPRASGAALRVRMWNENLHEKSQPEIAAIYPDGIHAAIAEGLRRLMPETSVATSTLDEPEHGLDEDALAGTDVLLWWGHVGHAKVDDAVVERVRNEVLAGMGLIVLHSAHFSKIFKALMGTTCSLQWRSEGERELVWTVNPSHPIARGVPSPLVIDRHETYGEYFDVPAPDELVFISSFAGGEVFRSGMTYRRGRGKVFYFSPGDQEYPIYHHPDVQRVLANAVRWAAPDTERSLPAPGHPQREWFEHKEVMS